MKLIATNNTGQTFTNVQFNNLYARFTGHLELLDNPDAEVIITEAYLDYASMVLEKMVRIENSSAATFFNMPFAVCMLDKTISPKVVSKAYVLATVAYNLPIDAGFIAFLKQFSGSFKVEF